MRTLWTKTARFKRFIRQVIAAGAGLLLAAPGFAQGNSPWENAVNVLQQAFTSTIARGLSLSHPILHRKNSLFYKTRKGAQMGDLYMSLIHTCELNDVNAFDYLAELLRHAKELKQNPSEWMPWNYRDTLARLARPAAA